MLDVKKCCLIVVDIQGKLAQLMHDKQRLFDNVEIMIKAARILDIPIVWCEQNPKALGVTLEQLTQHLSDNLPIPKFSFSCCADEKICQAIKETHRKQVILCGIEAHVCVYQTAMDLLSKEYDVCVLADSVSSRTAENKQIAINRMESEGTAIGSVEMVLFELLRTAKHEKFKDIARLIK